MSLNKILKKKPKITATRVSSIPQNKLLSSISKSTNSLNNENKERLHNWIIDTGVISCVPKNKIDITEYLNESNKLVLNCFDLDDTIITTKSKNRKFAVSPDDWKWLHENVVEKLNVIKSSKQNGIIVIFTNQGSVITTNNSKNQPSASLSNFQRKITNIIECLDIEDLHLYGCPKASALERKQNPLYANKEDLKNPFAYNRKPNMGMWQVLLNYLNIASDMVDFEKSVFVGDAAGRLTDFSDSDIKFAEKVGIKFYTPEEYFCF